MWLFHIAQSAKLFDVVSWYIQQEDHLWIAIQELFQIWAVKLWLNKKSQRDTVAVSSNVIRCDSFQVLVKFEFFQAWGKTWAQAFQSFTDLQLQLPWWKRTYGTLHSRLLKICSFTYRTFSSMFCVTKVKHHAALCWIRYQSYQRLFFTLILFDILDSSWNFNQKQIKRKQKKFNKHHQPWVYSVLSSVL